MKRILITALFCATVSLGAAQSNLENLNSDQKTELSIKRLRVKLDLNSKQVKEISPLLKEQILYREDFKKSSANLSSYEKRIQVLDRKIQFQESLKRILNKEQYTLWKKTNYKKRKTRNRWGKA
jgi:uncharacterized coiled-coil protein SlyX